MFYFIALLGGGEVLEHLVSLIGLEAAVDDGADGADHGGGVGGLEDVAAHVDAGGAFADGAVGELEGVALGDLLAAGDDNRDGAARDDGLEAFGVVGRDDVGAVLHAHPPTATGFAVAHVPLDRYDMIETVVALGSIPITPYGTPSTYEVPEAIAPYIQEHDAVLLENHGALTVGSNLVEAYYKMETLELFAKINLNAYLLGGPKEISRENIDKLINLRSYYGVKGRHPGYKHYQED